jgi:hypothetical protein
MFAGLLIIGIGFALIFGLGLHSEYIIASILVSVGFAFLSVKKVSISDIIGLVLLFSAIYFAIGIKFIENGNINLSLIPFMLLLIVGIISMYKVGKNYE